MVDVVTDLLLDGVGDTDVDVREPVVLYNPISCLLASRFFALLARGPDLRGEGNLFPGLVSGLFFTSPFRKCLEQTRW